MLYKYLISLYGSSLSGKLTLTEDAVWRYAPSEHLTRFREYALDALQQAKVYLLDHLAAEYADTLHDAITGNVDEGVSALAILGEVNLPSAVARVEFDDRALGMARFQRASSVTRFDKKPFGKGLRGYLLDGRNESCLRITMFHKRLGKGFVDPLCALVVKRSASGTYDYDDIEVELNQSMVGFHLQTGVSPEVITGMRTVQTVETEYDPFITYALFAMLVSPDLGGIIPSETQTFTPKDFRTAGKFGKSWILGAQKSHRTIQIGPQAVAHMAERAARLEFLRNSPETRNGPVRHWVVEHERHYRSSKVGLVNGHHRGHETAKNLPMRVMGPSLDLINFDFPITDNKTHD